MSIEQMQSSAHNELTRGNFDRAFAICRQILNRDPNSVLTYQLLGTVQEALGQPIAAMASYTRALELAPDRAEGYVYLAQLYRDLGWWDEAVSFYEQAIARAPNWGELHYYLGMVRHWQGQIDAAIDRYRRALALNPKLSGAYLDWALRLNERGQIEKAIQVLERGRIRCPDAKEILNTLGYLRLQQDRVEEAIAVFEQAIALDPEDGLVYNNLGWALTTLGKTAEAIAAYRRAVALEPDLAVVHSNLGKLWQRQNRHRKAIARFREAIAIEPDNIMFYSDCGSSCLAVGWLDEAMACFRKVIAIKPKFVRAFCQRFGSLTPADAGSDELLLAQIACAHFLETLQQLDLAIGNSENGGGSEDTSRDVPDAVYEYLEATYHHLGNALHQYGEFDAATRYYQRALRVRPLRMETYLELATCLVKQGRERAALAVCHMARTIGALSPIAFSPRVYWLLGNLLERQGNSELAIDYYSKVLQAEEMGNGEWGMGNGEWGIVDSPPTRQNTRDWLEANNLSDRHYIPIRLGKETGEGSENFPTPRDIPPRCGGLDCPPCLRRIFGGFRVTHLGYGLQRRTASPGEVRVPFETFVAAIPGGRAWIVPQENYWKVCRAIATLTPDNRLLTDLSREYPAPLPGCPKPEPEQPWILRAPPRSPPREIDGTVAVLSGISGHIYFHWMVDVLPRIELLRQAGVDFDRVDGFVVNSRQLPFQRETLNRLGIPESKIIESDRIPYLRARQLLVPSFASPTGWLQPWGLEFLRRTFLPRAQGDAGNYPDRIYVSRATARHRRVLNEEEVMAVLEPLGFVRILLEQLSFSQQVALFSRAKIIVGPHGSGLTNLAFCRPGTKAVEFISPHYDRHYYWVISQALGLEHYAITGDGFSCYPLRSLMYQNSLTEDIWVSRASLDHMIGQLGIS
ncbi:tetratricopeptide repeat protein [Lyngbya sp. CCY1209]|uniref:tetratricopeptide repeat protein n=1 Tax=Lyngbya sp. CCY1209 TaxID=2886103 RepID=UPI002D207649|nr:tetratricopeptide repeat protein [Lyngbya sp. CCY1209]MEB3884177.1 tetratricopeptide repeat protein [Lyngbya sp. CCY1209]